MDKKLSHPNDISKTFCSLAWEQLHVSPIGNVKPCCIFEGSIKNNDQSTLRIGDEKIEDIWNSDHLKEIRRKMLNGEVVTECAKCIAEEEVYDSSDRVRSFNCSSGLIDKIAEAKESQGHVSQLPQLLNLKIGNTCNLKCRMCQPLDSSSIDREYYQISKEMPEFRNFDNSSAFDYYFDTLPIETATNWITEEQAIANIEKLLGNGYFLSLAGGETTYTKEAMKLLKYCIDKGFAHRMDLSLSLNLTNVTDDFVKTLSAFRLCTVTVSIDGTEGLNDYIRSPSKWNAIKENFLKLVFAPENVVPVIAPTIQIYNILNFADILQLAEDLKEELHARGIKKWETHGAYHLTVLHSPHFLSIRHLPDAIKKVALDRLEKFQANSYYLKQPKIYVSQFNLVLEMLKQPQSNSGEFTSQQYLGHFLQYTNILDKHRNQSFESSCPELFHMLKNENIKPEFPHPGRKSYSYYRFRDVGFSLQSTSHEKALLMFNKAYELHQDDVDLLFSMGVSLKSINRSTEAKSFFEKVYSFNPSHYHNLIEMGFAQKDRKYLEEALRVEPSEARGNAEALLKNFSP